MNQTTPDLRVKAVVAGQVMRPFPAVYMQLAWRADSEAKKVGMWVAGVEWLESTFDRKRDETTHEFRIHVKE